MRISVRQQLSLLLVLSGVIGLAVLAIAVWVTNHDFVLNVSSSRLEITASLKAAQVAFNLEVMQTATAFVTTRLLIQDALARYNNGSDTASSNWDSAQSDLEATLGDVGALSNALVLQAEVFARNGSGPSGGRSVLNATGAGSGDILLPWLEPNGSQARLGQGIMGYPPALYPNLTMIEQPSEDGNKTFLAEYDGLVLDINTSLVLGPLLVNESFSLLSFTLPVVGNIVRKNTTDYEILGWVTVLTDARLIQDVIQDQRGLGTTGQTLLLGPVNMTNLFRPGIVGTDASGATDVHFLLPLNRSAIARHPSHVVGTPNLPFPASDYPAVEQAMSEDKDGNDDVGSMMETTNEEDKAVSVGYSVPPTDLVDWIVVVEQSRDEVWAPINRLRRIILACLFGVFGFLMIVSFPISHWFVLPIRRLRAATGQTVDPPATSASGTGSGSGSGISEKCGHHCDKDSDLSLGRKQTFVGSWTSKWRNRYRTHPEHQNAPEDGEGKPFRIPGKVKIRKHYIKDEMSDLILTFNEMSDELLIQYTKLEDRVRQRTIELEHSKKAAEAANESKTMFVANVSHELKTPLNGILGMSAVAMEEDDPQKLKRSLGIIYKSGDLLLRTLTDLLTFSTNQVGHQVLKLEEKEFNLRDLEAQIMSIFGDQAGDRQINLRVQFEDTPGYGGSGMLKDACLWGDVHRILQVIINLVSNALKFTPAGGSVVVLVRSLAEAPQRRASLALARTTSGAQRNRQSARLGSVSSGTANFINPREAAEMQEKVAAPPGKDLFIELEVRDTGEGIPEDQQHRIFEPFVQGDVGLSRKHSGTGLGLSICSQLASLMGGSIRLHSTVGQGSVFTFKVPVRQLRFSGTPKTSQDGSRDGSRPTSMTTVETSNLQRHPTNSSSSRGLAVVTDITNKEPVVEVKSSSGSNPPTPTNSRPTTTPLKQAVKNASKEVKSKKEAKNDFSHIRVLVAEDNKVNQEVIIRMLKLEQIHDVTIAEDGQKALDLIKTQSAPGDLEGVTAESPYDLIFMDVQMPNMDGLTSTKLIREHGFRRPIVALTAYAEQANIDQCLGSGMDYFLAKPIRRPQLKKVLTEYCTPSPLKEEEPSETQAVAIPVVGSSEIQHESA